ncbi:GTPase HflX [Phototrophicus methaneseepsis]|uniref:GTPase HflX n=1 Tax=Phototrophicus methaneseepsis TaxID=2710758 RepID=A0A7S8E6I0_9CHLR|nr:GTPase HflX [Phototrophicus methaneseepsis]QPC81203.1 GTPase HflX [Phototrophicus methaneseepsis]
MHQNEFPKVERAFLVGAEVRGTNSVISLQDSLSELALLAETAGMEVVGQTTQTLNSIVPATFIGSGKLEEVQAVIKELEADAVIFDDELSPRHQREISKVFGNDIKLLDRSALILDIFAQHAKTKEGSLQVELAQYEYRLPRLTRQWTHLARQAGGSAAGSGVGGVGLRGPGETQLEVDRREIGRKIDRIKRDLEGVRQHRSQHRQQRRKTGIPVIALVGYTNAGKSTLLNHLTNASVYAQDQLFATLDPTTRRTALPSGRQVLLTDTVGFIQKLPTTLIAAFRATLEETQEASMLLHMVDISHPNVVAHIDVVEDTLAEIDVPSMPRILVWNKIDRWAGDTPPQFPDSDMYREQVCISARTGEGVPELLEAIERVFAQELVRITLQIPFERGDLVSRLYRIGRVLTQESSAEGMILDVEIPKSAQDRYQDFAYENT